MVEIAIALFNGDGVDKDQPAAATWFAKAAEQGSAIARNRLARLYAAGQGIAADPRKAGEWNWLAKASGRDDPWLDDFMRKQPKDVQDAAFAAAKEHGF